VAVGRVEPTVLVAPVLLIQAVAAVVQQVDHWVVLVVLGL